MKLRCYLEERTSHVHNWKQEVTGWKQEVTGWKQEVAGWKQKSQNPRQKLPADNISMRKNIKVIFRQLSRPPFTPCKIIIFTSCSPLILCLINANSAVINDVIINVLSRKYINIA